jgi:uncharacterized protein YqjF (DUF2071 family)
MTRQIVLSDPRTAGYQSWQKLAFLHWRVSAESLQKVIPDSLIVEQFDGSAWLGVVPFSMERIRPWWFCAVPGISWFLETNVRTYVVDRRGVRGVWFFSLDANKQLAVSVARTFWHLPYKMARLKLNTQESSKSQQIAYSGTRLDTPSADYSIAVDIDRSCCSAPAAEGSLEHFLVERYILFAQLKNGLLMTGEVHHEPYQLRPVNHCQVTQTLTDAMGCPFHDAPFDHVAYSDGVDVRVSPLTTVTPLSS